MKKLRYQLEYFCLRSMAFFVSLLPWRLLPFVARVLGKLLSFSLPSRAKIVNENLKIAFPEFSHQDLKKIVDQFWCHITLTILECLRGTRDLQSWLRENVVLENRQIVDEALAQNRGVLFHTGHFGNWEFTGLALSLVRFPLCVLGRRQKNPYVDQWLRTLRERFGTVVLDHHQAVRETQDWLTKNGCLGILMDHNLYKGGIFVDFFGRLAATTTLTALLHLRLGSPIVGVYAYRKNGRHRIRFEKIDVEVKAENQKEAARLITQVLTKKIEGWVRENPANWLWGHNRWKRQP